MGTELDDTVARAYARWAPFYDLVFGEVFKHARRAAVTAAERTGGRILEVGVGTGISLPNYAAANRLVGVDLSEPMLRKAHERVRDLGLRHVEGLAVMDAERMVSRVGAQGSSARGGAMAHAVCSVCGWISPGGAMRAGSNGRTECA
jgi:predicted TPR repeat methyltransferase